MPRHIEQPACRHSKPALVKTRSRPSSSAWRFTFAEPGTTIARTVGATCRPETTAAAARRSSIRAFVHEPMKTRSMPISLDRRARLEVHVAQRPLDRLALGRVVERGRVGHAPSTGATMPGFVPQVTCGRQRRHVDLDYVVEARAVVGAQRRATRRARAPTRRRSAQRAGPRGRRRSCRQARPSPPARRPRSTCCRPSSGPPSRAPRSPARRTRSRGRRRRRRRCGRSRRAPCPSP